MVIFENYLIPVAKYIAEKIFGELFHYQTQMCSTIFAVISLPYGVKIRLFLRKCTLTKITDIAITKGHQVQKIIKASLHSHIFT